MALVNHAKKEINAKIVYFGPAESGKRTALSYIYSRIKPALRGELRTVPAGSDNLVFFDFSPFDAPLPSGFHLRLHIYTLTGNVTNPATWKMTLKSADGIMIMVNPALEHEAVTKESVLQLRDFLSGYGVGLHETPAVLQLNSFGEENSPGDVTEYAAKLDLDELTTCHTNAACGDGILDALTKLSRQVLERILAKEEPAQIEIEPAESSSIDLLEPPKYDSSVKHDLDNSLNLAVLQPEFTSEEQIIRIPLKINAAAELRTLVVTISVKLE